MPNMFDRISRFFSCFKKQDHERDEFDRLVGKIDDEVTGAFNSRVDEYTSKAGTFIDKWLDGENRKECKSMLKGASDEIHACFNEARSMAHDMFEYEPPSKSDRFCGRVEQLFDDMFGD